jgi:hypothetical protein
VQRLLRSIQLIFVATFLISCSSQSIQEKRLGELTCRDGSSTYRSGSGVVYTPTEAELLQVAEQLPEDRVLSCWSLRPSGTIDVLSVDADGTARSTIFVIGDNGLTRSSRPEEYVFRVH